MAEYSPIPICEMPEAASDGLSLADFGILPKWRVFAGYEDVRPGTSKELEGQLVWSVSPGEWTVIGPRPNQRPTVDLTHVRVMFCLTGENATPVLAKVCALDLTEAMFPQGAAARTLVAGVATELVRDDQNGVPSFLILPSRSFGWYLHEVLIDAGAEFGLSIGQTSDRELTELKDTNK